MLCSTLQRPSNWTMPDALSPSKSTAAFPRPAHFVPATHRATFRYSLFAIRFSPKSQIYHGFKARGFAGAYTDETRRAHQGHIRLLLAKSEKRRANGGTSV